MSISLDTDEAEDRAQVRLLEVIGLLRHSRRIEAAAQGTSTKSRQSWLQCQRKWSR